MHTCGRTNLAHLDATVVNFHCWAAGVTTMHADEAHHAGVDARGK